MNRKLSAVRQIFHFWNMRLYSIWKKTWILFWHSTWQNVDYLGNWKSVEKRLNSSKGYSVAIHFFKLQCLSCSNWFYINKMGCCLFSILLFPLFLLSKQNNYEIGNYVKCVADELFVSFWVLLPNYSTRTSSFSSKL